jgi:hypothetical protein
MRPGSVSKAEMLMSLPEPPFVARSVALIGHLVNCPAAWVTCAASDFVVRLPQAQFAGRHQHVRHVKLHHDSQYMRRDTTRREVTDGEDRIASFVLTTEDRTRSPVERREPPECRLNLARRSRYGTGKRRALAGLNHEVACAPPLQTCMSTPGDCAQCDLCNDSRMIISGSLSAAV